MHLPERDFFFYWHKVQMLHVHHFCTVQRSIKPLKLSSLFLHIFIRSPLSAPDAHFQRIWNKKKLQRWFWRSSNHYSLHHLINSNLTIAILSWNGLPTMHSALPHHMQIDTWNVDTATISNKLNCLLCLCYGFGIDNAQLHQGVWSSHYP